MITALGLGTKQAPDNVNLDPQRQFWSWLRAFLNPNENGDNNAHQRAYFSGFSIRQNDPAGMSILIGGTNTPDSAVLVVAPAGKPVLLSTDGTPQEVTIPTAPASGSRIDAVVSYIDTTSPDAEAETPGTPEYAHTIVVSGTAASSPSAPTHEQIIAALPAGAGGTYYRWCDVRVAQGTTTITNSNITDRKPASPNLYWTKQEIKDVASPKKASYTGNLTYSNEVHCERYGDVVCVTMNSADGTKLPKSGTSAGQLPVGYRPITAASTLCRYGANPTATPNVYADNIGFLTVNTNGTVSWALSTTPPAVQRWTWSISYTTNNAFPG